MNEDDDTYKILDEIKSYGQKVKGDQEKALEYQLLRYEKKIEKSKKKFKQKLMTSKVRYRAKIFKEKKELENVQNLINSGNKSNSLIQEKMLITKKIHFLQKAEKSALDTEEKVSETKTTGNLKIELQKMNINPVWSSIKIAFYIDSESKCEIPFDFLGEIYISLNNSIEFEIILFKNETILSVIYFPCENLIYDYDKTKYVIDFEFGVFEIFVTFERSYNFIRRKGELINIYDMKHHFESSKIFSTFKCGVCHQFGAILSVVYRCINCEFICHKRCARFILFECRFDTQETDSSSLIYNIPHNLNEVNSYDVISCDHCGLEIKKTDKSLHCCNCDFWFHSKCSHFVFNSCQMSFGTRCAFAELFADKYENKEIKQTVSIIDFTLLKVLGRGNYGKVMLAQHKKENVTVALKIIRKEILIDANEMAYIELERKVLNFCTIKDHPFLIKMIYCFQDKRRIFFGTEFVSGGDLFHLTAKIDLSCTQIKLYAAEILLAIKFLHENSICYRDLKLENVLISEYGHIKLADFGLCKDNIGPFNVTFTYCGTPNNMAPEIITEGGYTKDADWWSYGIVLYEMFEGKMLFDGVTAAETAYNILYQQIRFYKTPEIARDLIIKLLVKNPNERIGFGENDGNEIMKHPYFSYINWDDVYKKLYKPTFIPDSSLIENFDQEYMEEEIRLTPCSSLVQYNAYFQNFN